MTGYKKVFLDTAPIIYYLQKDKNFFEKTKEILLDLISNDAKLVTSDITTEEYCVYPLRNGETNLIEKFDSFIEQLQIEVVHTTEPLAKNAAMIRAEYPGFKAMDALQIASAQYSDCEVFLTNDKQLRHFKNIKVVTVEEWE